MITEMVPLLYILLSVVVIFVVDRLTRPKHRVPGPNGLPVLGNAPWLLWHMFVKGDVFDVFIPLHEKYGDTLSMRLIGNDGIVLITDLEDLKHFFQSPNFEKGKYTSEILEDIFGHGIFAADGEDWKVQRQTASSLFHFNNLQAFVPLFHERANVMTAILADAVTSGSKIDVQQLFMKYTLDSIGQLGFGISIDSLKGNEDALQFASSYDYIQAATEERVLIHPFWKLLPRGTFQRHLDNVNNFLNNIVANRRQEMEKGVDFSDRIDLLSKFISAKNAQGELKFDDKYLVDVLKNFLIAGRDTTAVTLTWTMYLLALHPEVEEKVAQEIQQVLGNDEPTYEKLKLLKYTKQVIDESLRLYPSVPMDVRCTVEEDMLPSGHRLPPGSKVNYSAYAIHRLPKYWKNPLEFNPDRWETDTIKPFQFVAFHGGPRICLGQNLAYEEVKVALCAIIPKFRFRLVDPAKVHYAVSITLPAKNGMEMWVTAK